ncbi:MAG: hydroxymethylbilane synthase, partial [Betaproteobacteria bacterium]
VLAGAAAAAALVAPLEHADTRDTTAAERAVSRGLGGSCQVPLAAYAEIEGGTLRLRAIVGNQRSGEHLAVEVSGARAEGAAIAAEAVAQLKGRGAMQLLGA